MIYSKKLQEEMTLLVGIMIGDMAEDEVRLQLALGTLHKYIIASTEILRRQERADQTEDERRSSYIVLAKDEMSAKIKVAAIFLSRGKLININSLQCYDYFKSTRPIGDCHTILADVDIA